MGDRETIPFKSKGPIPVGLGGLAPPEGLSGTSSTTSGGLLEGNAGTAVLDLSFQYPCQVELLAFSNLIQSFTFHPHDSLPMYIYIFLLPMELLPFPIVVEDFASFPPLSNFYSRTFSAVVPVNPLTEHAIQIQIGSRY